MRTRRTFRILATSFVLMLAGTAVASAYSSSYSDLSGLPTLGSGYTTQGNVVGFWQNILYVDGYLTKCTSQGSNAIDGHFGSGSTASTKAWQTAKMGSGAADGYVGPNTWSKVWSLKIEYGYEPVNKTYNYGHAGSRGVVSYVRFLAGTGFEFEGEWVFKSFSNPGMGFIPITWPGVTFYTC